jgi:tetraacyldisaccharide 4'-kinase
MTHKKSNRKILLPLNPLYATATAARNLAFDRRILRAQSLPHPVISVGNLSTGGSGKTPFVLELAKLLTAASRQPVILSRGYGRSSNATMRVDPNGTADQFGDEPLLLARNSGVPVYVGPDRARAGQLAMSELSLGQSAIFLLDDGFQHRQLARDIDIVLITAADLHDHLLPGGNLREPFSALARAHILVLREEDAALAPQIRKRFHAASCSRPLIWTIRRSLDLSHLSVPPSASLAVAFAGIAHPEEFFAALRNGGVTLVGRHAFPDHHSFTFRDVATILATAKRANATTLLTTEKDFVRLDAHARESLEAALPLAAVPLRIELTDAALAVQQIFALCVRQS